MPYVRRDADGAIIAVFGDYVEEGLEEVATDDPALALFLARVQPERRQEWFESDLALARVVEDLIDILLEKKVIMFTDFPEGAQKKLMQRRGRRKEFAYIEGLFSDDDGFPQGGGGGFL